jgi:hypothetical protein
MEINEHKIRLSGTANIERPLDMSKTYGFLIDNAEIRKIEALTNDDGTYNKIFHIKISELSQVQIINGKEIIKAKIKGSPSQKLRNALFYNYQGDDFEKFYQDFMCNLIVDVENLIQKYERN